MTGSFKSHWGLFISFSKPDATFQTDATGLVVFSVGGEKLVPKNKNNEVKNI